MEHTSLKVIIRAPTLEEEFNNLKYVLKNKEFYEKNGYKAVYPNVIKLCDPLILNDYSKMFSLFKDKEYDASFYQNGIDVISRLLSTIQSNVNKLMDICDFWEFKVFKTYTVVLTKYGPGGSYDTTKGKITILTSSNGEFKRPHPDHTIVHEIVHIGIEDSIIQKYKLSHWEKERLVDLFVKKYFEKELPDYRLQNVVDTDINRYIVDLKSLPKEIQEYMRNKPNYNVNDFV